MYRIVQQASLVIGYLLITGVALQAQITPDVGPPIIFVKPVADGSGDGSSWGNATDDLQAAINSPRVIQVWVAAGTYVAPGTGFVMKNGVEIYGGFPVSGNPVMDDRSLPASEETGGEGFEGFSVLSGEGAIRAIDNNFEGASALDNSAVLDGFVLTGGDAASLGGAIVNAHASPTLRHLLITGNSAANEGGGIYNSNSSPVLTDIIISGNEADEGGGMFNLYGEPTLTNVTISGNSAGDRGGGMYNLNGTPTLTNVMFTGNSAGGNGGGMINNNSGSLTLRNVMFTGNSALHGGGMYNFDSSPTLTNTIIWGNTAGGDGNEIYNQSGLVTLEYSLYGNKSNDIANPNDGDIDAGDHSLTVDPQFADPGNGDYSLLNISPAINAGDNSPFESGGVAEGITTDLAGNARIFDGATDIVDMGAYEFQGEPLQLSPDGNVLYVNQNVPSGNESGNSWTNASPGLTAPLVWAKTNWDADTDGQLQIWVAEGSYLPYELYTTGEAYYFEIPAGTTLLGGFEGNEAAAGERNWAGHPTILSGDLNGSGSANEGDSHTIVRIDADDVTVDGFSVEYGFADDGSTLPGRTGAGFYADQAENLVINNTIFRNLVADDGSGNGVGGAVIAFGGAMDISNSLFHDNEATFGGAVSLEGSAGLTLINATLAANNAGDNGGALNTNGNSVTIVNTVFAGNTSYGNKNINGTTTAINYSYLQGQNPAGTGNIDGTTVTDLLFIDSGNDDYTLQDSSPAINTGNNTAIPSGITTDLAGNDRIFDTTIDIGAYEFQGEPFSIGPDDDNILYVDKNVDTEASGYDGAGDSWTNAIPELADALKWAREQHEDDDTVWDSDPLQIWVAEGTYLPLYNAADGSYTEDGGRDNAFVLVPNVQLYGGFDPDGGIDDLSDERIFPTTSPGEGTILSGDLDGNDNPGDFNNHTENTYHVVLAPGAATGGLLDGFTVQGGNGNGNGSSSVTSLGSSFHRFDGGGIFNLSTLTVRNGRLTQNRVERSGGGAKGGGLINRGDVTLRNVMVSGNHSSGGEGGGLYGAGSGTVDLANVLVAGNTAAQGAGLAILDGTTTLANTTITSNAADANGGGLAIIDASVEAANSIIWGNTALNDPEVMDVSDSFSATYSIVGGGTGGGLDTVPLFADASGGDYTLLNTSPAINSGDPSTDLSLFTGGPDDPLDLAGNVRVFDGAADPDIIDIGAYEFQGEPVTIPEAVVLSTPSDEAVNVGLTPEFTWQPADGADEYHLQVSGNEEFSSTVIDDSGLTETTFEPASDLDNATTYYWRVRASNEAGDGEWSEVFSFTTLPESSEVVILTDPSDDAADVPLKPLFEWNTATGADTYDLVVSPNSDFSDPVVDESGISATEFHTADNLGFSTMYYWQVRGVNAGGAGEWSEPFSFTTIPESSEVVILTDPSDDAADVPLKPLFEWNTATGADTYDLVVSPNSDFSDPVVEEEAIDDTEFKATSDLGFSTMYYWQVRGVNAGGAGEWSEPFSFTTQDRPEAADNRILVANTESYTFTPAGFGQADNNFLVVIDDLPGGFSGTLELDDGSSSEDVETGDEISVGDIDDEKLIYTPPSGGVYGYGFDSFEFLIEDNAGNQSEQSYTMSLDVAATSVELDYDGEGWRFLASPSDGETVGDFFEPIWTQGFDGSDSPGAAFVNVQRLNQEEYLWEPVESNDAELNTGDAVIAYVYGDDDNNGSDEGFPKTLTSSTTNWLNLDGSYEESFFYDPDQQETEDSFYLWGNPHPIALDLCQADLNNIPKNAYFWDPSAGGGNGNYVNLSCDGGDDVEIAPFQSVWLRLTDTNNSMELPSGTYLEGTTDGYFKDYEPSAPTKDLGTDGFLITMKVSSDDQQETSFINTTRVLFHEEASTGSDLIDAPKLSSAGLANRYLSLYSLDESGNSYALQALPAAMDEKTRIPLNIQTTESGRFTLDWTLPEAHVFSGSYFLRDNQTGEVMELREGSSYSFEVEPDQTSKVLKTLEVSGKQRSAKSPKDFADLGEVSDHRFELLITTTGVDGLSELGAVPEEFTLAQNYPNPFNPTTVINYQLPVSSQVRLEVYDMLGRSVATLVNEQVAAGRHTVNFDASRLSSGVYLYRLQAGSQIMTKKLTILK